MVYLDFIFFHQVLDPFHILGDYFFFASNHLWEVDRKSLQIDAVRGKSMRRIVVMLRRIQQRFGGNTAHIEAGAP